MHGAAPVSEHSDPEVRISSVQQVSERSVELAPHPVPPHVPHASTQHTSALASSTPSMPLLHTAPDASNSNKIKQGNKHSKKRDSKQKSTHRRREKARQRYRRWMRNVRDTKTRKKKT